MKFKKRRFISIAFFYAFLLDVMDFFLFYVGVVIKLNIFA